MKVKNCNQCRKQILQQAREEYVKREYAIFADSAYTMAVYSTVAALSAMARRGRSKDYIRKLYEDMLAVFDTPELFGKEISLTDMKNSLEKDYGLDFTRINVHIEDEKEFIKGLKNNG